MWDIAPMSIFINYSLCELFISSQYGTEVLQTPPLKPLTTPSGPCHAMLQYHMTFTRWLWYHLGSRRVVVVSEHAAAMVTHPQYCPLWYLGTTRTLNLKALFLTSNHLGSSKENSWKSKMKLSKCLLGT
jgi:hypothetical protein